MMLRPQPAFPTFAAVAKFRDPRKGKARTNRTMVNGNAATALGRKLTNRLEICRHVVERCISRCCCKGGVVLTIAYRKFLTISCLLVGSACGDVGSGQAQYDLLSSRLGNYVIRNTAQPRPIYFISFNTGLLIRASDQNYVATFIGRDQRARFVKQRRLATAVIAVSIKRSPKRRSDGLTTYTVSTSLVTGPATARPGFVIRTTSADIICDPNLSYIAQFSCRNRSGVPLAMAIQELARV